MRAVQYPEDFLFDLMFLRIRKLVPGTRGHLSPIVLQKGLWRRRNHHARTELAGARQVGDARGSHHSGKPRAHARSSQAIPASWAAMAGPDSRVSIPIRTGFAPNPWRCKSSPSATPSAATVFGSSGGSPATPRIPSVPNSRFPMCVFSLWRPRRTRIFTCNLGRIENPHLGLRGEDCQLPAPCLC